MGEFNFATHLLWITAMWWTSSSVLLYCDCVFEEVIDNKPKRRCIRERMLLYSMHLFVSLWWLSSVFYPSYPTTSVSADGLQLLFVVFGYGTHIAEYWASGPNEIYEIRIWWTNISHIVLDVIILLMPIQWIRRSQHTRLGQLVYILLFLAGGSWVSRSSDCSNCSLLL